MTLSLHTLSEHRSFSSVCLGLVESKPFLSVPDKEIRPVMLTFACNAQVYRPFTANIAESRGLALRYYKGGTPAEAIKVTLLRSAGYDLAVQAVPGRQYKDLEGNPVVEPDKMIGTYYLASAFALEPSAAETERCDFLMLPTALQLAANSARLDNKAIVTHLVRTGKDEVPADMLGNFGALACLWAGYVDRRVAAPIIQEPAFFAHAFYDAIKAGFVTTSQIIDPADPLYRGSYGMGWGGKRDFLEAKWSTCTYGLGDLGFHPRVYTCNASCDQMQGLLAASIKSYSAATAGRRAGGIGKKPALETEPRCAI